MRLFAWLACVCSAAICSGCGQSLPDHPPATQAPPKVGPHGGMALVLPDDLGFVEIVNEPPVENRAGAKPTAIVAYFLGAEAKEPGKGSTADLKIAGKAGRTPLNLDLSAQPGSSAATNRYATSLGMLNLEEVRGELTGKIDGKPFKVDLNGVR